MKDGSTKYGSSNIDTGTFVQYFKAVNNPEDQFYQADEDVLEFNERYLDGELQIMFEELDTEITYDEISKAIKSLNPNKSAGPDIFINEFFIHGKANFLGYFHKLFNTCLNTGYFPKLWSEGFIVPIPKHVNVNDVSNYRGISLLSNLGKLFTRILNTRFDAWA